MWQIQLQPECILAYENIGRPGKHWSNPWRCQLNQTVKLQTCFSLVSYTKSRLNSITTLGKQLPCVELQHNPGFLPSSLCRWHPSQLCERKNLELAGYDKFFLSNLHSSWWHSSDCNHHTIWPVWVDGNATRTEKHTVTISLPLLYY